MADTRIITIPTKWALNAVDVPYGQQPVEGTAYGKTDLVNNDLEKGWQYKVIQDSSIFNELMRRMTGLAELLEQYGVLPWCASTAYKVGGLAIGYNNKVYQAIIDNTNVDPTTTGSTTWRLFGGIFSPGIGVYTAGATLTSTDFGRATIYQSESAGTLILPSVAAGPVGSLIMISSIAAGICTVQRAGSAVIDAFGVYGQTSIALAAGDNIILATNGTDWLQVAGSNVSLSKFVNVSSSTEWTTTLPDGTIMKRGFVNNASTAASLQLTFSYAFPNYIQTLNLTSWANQGGTGVYNHTSKDATGALIYRGGTASSYYYDYLAFGR
jgi:hypothetical protein